MKIIRIDLNNKKYKIEEIPEEWYRKYIGTRGIGVKYYYEEVDSNVSPLGEENKIIIMTGPFNGTSVFSSPKFTATTKSPLTGFYGEASTSGGKFASYLKLQGIDGIIVEGKSDSPIHLHIEEGKVLFNDANKLWGLPITETERLLKRGRDLQCAIIGPAGENLVKFACVRVERRTFGRCGIGAVFGSKNLKAITIAKGNGKIKVADEEALKEANKEFFKRLRETPFTGKVRPMYGTTHLVEGMNDAGILATRNFQKGQFKNAERIGSKRFREEFRMFDGTCERCPIACEKSTLVKKGEYAGTTHSGPEFETIWAFGPQCENSSLESILKANRLCNELGMDTITTGNLMGFLMECYEKGLIKDEDLGGSFKWGDHKKIIELIKKIAYREDIGDMLAEGTRSLSKKLKAEDFAIHVKGMELPAYDPRGLLGMGLAYATSSRGGCHLRMITIREELLGDRYAVEGKAELIKEGQDIRTAYECAGLCYTATVAIDFQLFTKIFNSVTGLNYSESELKKVGERVYNLERLSAVKDGITRKDDTLPERFFKEKLKEGPADGRIISKEDFNKMLDEYYKLRGWDLKTGLPTSQKLSELGINVRR